MVQINSTLSTYEGILKMFLNWLFLHSLIPDTNDTTLHHLTHYDPAVTVELMYRFLSHKQHQGLDPSTVWDNYYSALSHYVRAMTGFTLRDSWDYYNPTLRMNIRAYKRFFSRPNQLRSILNLSQILLMARFLITHYPQDPRPALNFLGTRLLACRVGELIYARNDLFFIDSNDGLPFLFMNLENSKVVSPQGIPRFAQLLARTHPLLCPVRIFTLLLQRLPPQKISYIFLDKNNQPYTHTTWTSESRTWFQAFVHWLNTHSDTTLSHHTVLGKDTRPEGVNILASLNFPRNYIMALTGHKTEEAFHNHYEKHGRLQRMIPTGMLANKKIDEIRQAIAPDIVDIPLYPTPKKSRNSLNWTQIRTNLLADPTPLELSTKAHLENIISTKMEFKTQTSLHPAKLITPHTSHTSSHTVPVFSENTITPPSTTPHNNSPTPHTPTHTSTLETYRRPRKRRRTRQSQDYTYY